MLIECTQNVFEIAFWKCECYYTYVLVNKLCKEMVFARYLEIYSVSSILKDGLFKTTTTTRKNKPLNFILLSYTLDF